MKKLNKTGLALGVALAVASSGAFAGDFIIAGSAAVGVEASTTGSLTATVTAGGIELDPATAMSQDNRLFITLTNGATFADSAYVLEQSTTAATGDITEFVLITPTTAGATTLEFRAASTIDPTHTYSLSGSTVVGQDVIINIPSVAAGAEIDIDANADDSFGTFDFYTAGELFQAANQFTANVDGLADATVDVNADRLTFTSSATTDVIGLEFNDAGTGNGVNLASTGSADTVNIVLSGDMSGIASIALATAGTGQGNFTIDEAAGTATFAAEASDVFSAASTTLTTTVTGSAALATRTFTVQADLDFESETDVNLITAGTAAGSWTINGLQAKVAHLSLNVSGFISWLKVVNEGTAGAEITADIIWTLADGTEGSVSNAALGEVDAGGVFTVSEASILTAIGSPTQVADISMTVTVAGQTDLVHLTAEKKASDGRTTLPVYYNTTGANARSWVQ